MIEPIKQVTFASPGRKTGCGLKHRAYGSLVDGRVHHPVERPGAD